MKKSLLAVPAVLLLAGCETVSWLQPLYAPEDVVFDSDLAGVWRTPEDDTLSISLQGQEYLFTLEEKESRKTVFTGQFLRINGELYADIVEKGPGIPDHMLVRVEIEGDRMTWFTLKDDWLKKSVKNGLLPATRIDESRKDTRWVVNVPPEEAQRILRSCRYDAWEESVRFERIS